MSKVKGMKKVTKKVSKILRKEFGVKKVVFADTYMYDFNSDSVYFKITHAIEDEMFNRFMNERFGLELNAESGFIFSLLHEVGHRENNDDVEGAVYDFCLAEKARLEKEIQSNPGLTFDELYALESQYFNLPDEIMATAWAVDFYKKNPEKCVKMHKKIAKTLQKFYKMNNYEG